MDGWKTPETAPEGKRLLVWLDEKKPLKRGAFFGRAWRDHTGVMRLSASGHNGNWNVTHWQDDPIGPNGEPSSDRL